MEIIERRVGDVSILDIKGKILVGETEQLLEKVSCLAGEGRLKIVLNLAETPYVDSMGLGEIVRSFSLVERRGGRLKLLRITRKIKNLLETTKLMSVFEVFGDEATAIASFVAR